MRGQVVAEVGNESYRLARIRPIEEVPAPQEVMRARRQQLIDLFTSHPIAATVMARQFMKILATPMPTAEIIDLAAFTFMEDAAVKQSLLADADVARRTAAAITLLGEAVRSISPEQSVVQGPSSSAASYRNPSLN